MTKQSKDAAAVSLGQRGGSVSSEAKTKAARENGEKGGRPVLTGKSKGARTRQWNKLFDPTPYLRNLGLESDPASSRMSRVAPGKACVGVYTDRPGKVTLNVLKFADGSKAKGKARRTFGAYDFESMLQWYENGCVLPKEQDLKRVRNAAPDLLQALKEHLRWYEGATNVDETALIAATRAAIAKAEPAP